jgi:hypothetical protein
MRTFHNGPSNASRSQYDFRAHAGYWCDGNVTASGKIYELGFQDKVNSYNSRGFSNAVELTEKRDSLARSFRCESLANRERAIRGKHLSE